MGYNQGGILGSYWYSTWDMIGDSYLGSIWSTLRTTILVQLGVQTVKCLGISHFIIVTEIKLQSHGLRPGICFHGGLPVLPCDAMRGNRDSRSHSHHTT